MPDSKYRRKPLTMKQKYALGVLGTFAFLCVVLIRASFSYESSSLSREPLANIQLEELAARTNIQIIREDTEKISIVRVSDTPGIAQVREYILNGIKPYTSWNVEVQTFSDSTPYGTKQFSNIIATWSPAPRKARNIEPDNEKRVILAAHYDSKLFDFHFEATTDSAVPCAILLDLIRTLDGEFSRYANTSSIRIHPQLSLQIIFFDGEEAFKQWTSTDSLYGSRYLASYWEQLEKSGEPYDRKRQGISNIELFILFDLWGSSDPIPEFRSMFASTQPVFDQLAALERRLVRSKLYDITRVPESKAGNPYMSATSAGRIFIEDDHVPFHKRKVPIVHLIPVRFPSVWHTQQDSIQIVDWSQVENLATLMRCWVAEYFNFQTVTNF
jgi:glutaminyl-peptide cyclotransferase